MLAIHIERGKRHPLTLIGSVDSIEPPRGTSGLEAWSTVTLSTPSGKQRFFLLVQPPALELPFVAGERVSLEIDCRKGGWQRVCDGVITDMNRRRLVIISGSGSEEVAKDWSIRRGPVVTSVVRPGPPRSVQHTHALELESEGASVTAMPWEWTRAVVHDRSYLVTGYEVMWEGIRPPDARDHRTLSIVLER